MGSCLNEDGVPTTCESIDVICPMSSCEKRFNFLDFSTHIWENHMSRQKSHLPKKTCDHCLKVVEEGQEKAHLDKTNILRDSNVIVPQSPTCGQCPIYYHEKGRLRDALAEWLPSAKGCLQYTCTVCSIYFGCYRDYTEHMERKHRTRCFCPLCCCELKCIFNGKNPAEYQYTIDGRNFRGKMLQETTTKTLLRGTGAMKLYERIRDHFTEHIASRVKDIGKCTECEMTFANQEHCYRHIFQMHQPGELKVHNRAVCPQCTKPIGDNESMREHLENAQKCKSRDTYPVMIVSDWDIELKDNETIKKRTNVYEIACTICENDLRFREHLPDHFIAVHGVKSVEQAKDAPVEYIGQDKYEFEFDRLRKVNIQYWQQIYNARQQYPETKRNLKATCKRRRRSPINVQDEKRLRNGTFVPMEREEWGPYEIAKGIGPYYKRPAKSPVELKEIALSKFVLENSAGSTYQAPPMLTLDSLPPATPEQLAKGMLPMPDYLEREPLEEVDERDDYDEETEVEYDEEYDEEEEEREELPVGAKRKQKFDSVSTASTEQSEDDSVVLVKAVTKKQRTKQGRQRQTGNRGRVNDGDIPEASTEQLAGDALAFASTNSGDQVPGKEKTTTVSIGQHAVGADAEVLEFTGTLNATSTTVNHVPSNGTEESTEREGDLGMPNTSIANNDAALNRQVQVSADSDQSPTEDAMADEEEVVTEVLPKASLTSSGETFDHQVQATEGTDRSAANDAPVEEKVVNEEVEPLMPREPLSEKHACTKDELLSTVTQQPEESTFAENTVMTDVEAKTKMASLAICSEATEHQEKPSSGSEQSATEDALAEEEVVTEVIPKTSISESFEHQVREFDCSHRSAVKDAPVEEKLIAGMMDPAMVRKPLTDKLAGRDEELLSARPPQPAQEAMAENKVMSKLFNSVMDEVLDSVVVQVANPLTYLVLDVAKTKQPPTSSTETLNHQVQASEGANQSAANDAPVEKKLVAEEVDLSIRLPKLIKEHADTDDELLSAITQEPTEPTLAERTMIVPMVPLISSEESLEHRGQESEGINLKASTVVKDAPVEEEVMAEVVDPVEDETIIPVAAEVLESVMVQIEDQSTSLVMETEVPDQQQSNSWEALDQQEQVYEDTDRSAANHAPVEKMVVTEEAELWMPREHDIKEHAGTDNKLLSAVSQGPTEQTLVESTITAEIAPMILFASGGETLEHQAQESEGTNIPVVKDAPVEEEVMTEVVIPVDVDVVESLLDEVLESVMVQIEDQSTSLVMETAVPDLRLTSVEALDQQESEGTNATEVKDVPVEEEVMAEVVDQVEVDVVDSVLTDLVAQVANSLTTLDLDAAAPEIERTSSGEPLEHHVLTSKDTDRSAVNDEPIEKKVVTEEVVLSMPREWRIKEHIGTEFPITISQTQEDSTFAEYTVAEVVPNISFVSINETVDHQVMACEGTNQSAVIDEQVKEEVMAEVVDPNEVEVADLLHSLVVQASNPLMSSVLNSSVPKIQPTSGSDALEHKLQASECTDRFAANDAPVEEKVVAEVVDVTIPPEQHVQKHAGSEDKFPPAIIQQLSESTSKYNVVMGDVDNPVTPKISHDSDDAVLNNQVTSSTDKPAAENVNTVSDRVMETNIALSLNAISGAAINQQVPSSSTDKSTSNAFVVDSIEQQTQGTCNQAVNVDQMPSEAIDDQMLSEAIDNQMLSEAIDNQMLSEAIDEQMPPEAFDEQMLPEAIDDQMQSEAIDDQMQSEAIDDQIPSEAIDDQMPPEAIDDQIQSEAIDDQMPSEAIDGPIQPEANDDQAHTQEEGNEQAAEEDPYRNIYPSQDIHDNVVELRQEMFERAERVRVRALIELEIAELNAAKEQAIAERKATLRRRSKPINYIYN